MPLYQIFVIVPRTKVKTAKVMLENEGCLDKSRKITRFPSSSNNEEHPNEEYILEPGSVLRDDEEYHLLPTIFAVEVLLPADVPKALSSKHTTILGKLPISASLAAQLSSEDTLSTTNSAKRDPLADAVESWLGTLPPTVLPLTVKNPFNSKAIGPYVIYPPLLLLSPKFLLLEWPDVQSSVLGPYLPSLFALLCQRLNVTHIAINAPIPPNVSSLNQPIMMDGPLDNTNRLRSPSNLITLYGDFGPPFQSKPTNENLAKALWVSTTQYGIAQIWAPLHTMFSRRNINEKARVLALCESTIPDPAARMESTAVDLYAGIGYFSFCYAKSGFGLVLCWDLNGWSVEGGRRGAEENGWNVGVVKGNKEWEARGWYAGMSEAGKECRERIVFFHEDNEKAADRIRKLKERRVTIPPIRHVNLGLLPTSRSSWVTAVWALDDWLGGWIHVHENCPKGEIEERRKEIELRFMSLVTAREAGTGASERGKIVRCEHVEEVKTYAPGIIHCVFDIAVVPPTDTHNTDPAPEPDQAPDCARECEQKPD